MLTTKQKGDIGLTKVIAELTEQLYGISLPLSEHLKYDAIAEKNGKMARIQVKYVGQTKGKIEIKVHTVWSNKKGSHISKREKGDYDILVVYCPETKKCYFLSDSDFENGTTVTLRVEAAKNKNSHIRWAKDYEDVDKAFNKV